MRFRYTLLALLFLLPAVVHAQSVPLPAAACASLRADRAALPTPMTQVQRGIMLNRAAWAARAAHVGVSRKVSGTMCPAPPGSGSPTISCDTLFLENPASPATGPWSYWDVIVGDAAQSINCGASTNKNADPARRWLAPVEPAGSTTPPPVPPDSDLSARVAVLEATVKAQSNQLAILDARVTVLGNRVTALESAPGSTACVASELTTSRDGGGWFGPGHTHRVVACAPPK